MSEDTQINVGMNVDGVATGVNKAKAELRTLQAEVDKVSKLSKEGGAALVKVGDGVDSEKAVKQLSRLAQQVKRVSEEAVLGRNSVELFANRLEKTGVGKDVYKPLLDAFAQVKTSSEQANAAFTQSGKVLNEYGMGAKATAAALRQVPAQFTDIIVSLQGGQAPLTVLLQQGGQLKDVFGSAGGAFKAMSGYVLGLINPVTLLAGAAAVSGLAYKQATDEVDAYRKALVLSGNAIGATTGQLQAMSAAIGGKTSFTVGAAAEAMAQLAGAGTIAADNLEKFTLSAIRMEKYAGVAVKDTVKAFSELADDPVKGSEKLTKQYNYLTAAVYEQIRALAESGDKYAAVSLAQNELANAQSRMSAEIESNLGRVEQAWRNAGNVAKWAWDEFLGLFRPDSIETTIGKLQKQLDALKASPSILVVEATKQTQADLDYWKHIKASQDDYAKAQEQNKRNTEAQIKLDQAYIAGLDKQSRMKREIAELAGTFNSGNGLSPEQAAQYAIAIKGIQNRYAETPKKAKEIARDQWDKSVADAYVKSMEAMAKVELAASGAADTLSKSQLALRDVQASPQWEKFSRQQQEQVIYAASLAQAEEDRAAATKAATKALEAATTASHKYYADLANNNDALEKSNKALADETGLIGLSEAAKGQLTLARLDAALATEQEAFSLLNLQNSSEVEIATAQKRITLLKEQRALTGRNIEVKAAAEAAAEWKKSAESIRDSLTDAFLSAIDNGKSLFVNLRDAVVAMFKNMVLRPVVQGIMGGIVAGASGSAAASIGGDLASSIGISALGKSIGASVGDYLAPVTSMIPSMITGAMATGASAASAASAGLAYSGAVASGSGGSFLAGSSLSSTLAAVPAWGWAAMGVAAVAALFGGSKPHAVDTGRSTIDYSASGIGGSAYNTTGSAAQILAATDATNALAKTYFATAAALGIQAVKSSFQVGYNDGGDTGKTVLGVNAGGKSYSSGELVTGDSAALQLAANRAVLTALQGSELPTYLSGVFDGITASTATQEQISAALQGAAALATFHKELLALPFANVADLSYAATQELIGFSGGLDNLKSNLSAYYTNFYSAEEQRAQTIKNINAATIGSGLDAATATRETFRALVEAQDLSTESGRKMYAALISVSGAFAGLTPALKTAAETATSTRKLEIELLKLQGNDMAALTLEREAELAALDPANQAIQKRIYALQDEKAAADKAAAAHAKLVEELTDSANKALQILTNAVDTQREALQASYDARIAILNAQRKATETVYTAQAAILGASLSSAKTLASAMQAEANRIQGYVTGMTLAENTPGQSQASALAQAKMGNSSDAVLKAATNLNPEDFASWNDYALAFYETQNVVGGLAASASRRASESYSQVTFQEAQLAAVEEQYKADIEHYTLLETAAAEQLKTAQKGYDDLLKAAQAQLEEALGTKLAVMSLNDALNNYAGALSKLSIVMGTSVTTPTPTVALPNYSSPIYTSAGTTTNSDVIVALEAVVAELQALRVSGADTTAAVQRTANLIDLVTAGGNAMLTETV